MGRPHGISRKKVFLLPEYDMKQENYFFVELPDVRNGEVFEDCNLTRPVPARVFAGKRGLRFVRCNMTNCVPPKDSVIEKCNLAQVRFSRKKMMADSGPTVLSALATGLGDGHVVTQRDSRTRRAIKADSTLREVG